MTAIEDLILDITASIDRYKTKLELMDGGLTSMDQCAIARGMEVRRSYTIVDCAKITGISEWAIRKAIECGKLKPIFPEDGSKHGMKIKSTELQRWFDTL